MAENDANAAELLLLADNEGIDKELLGVYTQQVKANKKYMKLSFLSKQKLVEGAKEELARFSGIITAGIEGVNANEFLADFE